MSSSAYYYRMKDDPEFKRKRKEYSAKYHQRKKAENNAKSLAWIKANPEKALAAQHAYYARSHVKSLLRLAKKRAKKRGLPFDLTPEDITIPEVCPYFLVPMRRAEKGGNLSFSPSIDRIDSNKGYTKDNVQVISRLANCMKWTSTPAQLVTFAEGVIRVHKQAA